jgi:hypothetical protein
MLLGPGVWLGLGPVEGGVEKTAVDEASGGEHHGRKPAGPSGNQ